MPKLSEPMRPEDKEKVLLHEFSIKLRTGGIVKKCRVAGRSVAFPMLYVPHADFGTVQLPFAWETLRDAMLNDRHLIA